MMGAPNMIRFVLGSRKSCRISFWMRTRTLSGEIFMP